VRQLRIQPVWTPTEASWFNLIEAQFGILKRCTLTNTNDPSHTARRRRIYAYLRYRHRKLANLHLPLNAFAHLGLSSWNNSNSGEFLNSRNLVGYQAQQKFGGEGGTRRIECSGLHGLAEACSDTTNKALIGISAFVRFCRAVLKANSA
jgi:hypothetical protein